MKALRDAGRLTAGTLFRRLWLAGPLLLAACAGATTQSGFDLSIDPAVVQMYAAPEDEPFRVPRVNVAKIDPKYYRQVVAMPPELPQEPPGTIIVDPVNFFLYLVGENGQATRYGIGVGKEGFAWWGEATVNDKSPWPKWFPPAEMRAREPKFAKYEDGMEGGPTNPLGARALYLWSGDKDTLYRIHGTIEPWSIGTKASSGCIRLFNQDIIDLYNRVNIGTRVVVVQSPGVPSLAEHLASGHPGTPPA